MASEFARRYARSIDSGGGLQVQLIQPQWPTPSNVHSIVTTRLGGVSRPPFDSLNLASHVGDVLDDVMQNRRYLFQSLTPEVGRVSEPGWLQQVHGVDIVDADSITAGVEADGVYSAKPGYICAVLTADCLPVLLCSRKGDEVAAVHAGWQGLANGVITEALSRFRSERHDVLCYLGPAISRQAFEVGEDVYQAFMDAQLARNYAEPVEASFDTIGREPKKFQADLYRLARSELNGAGVEKIFGGECCTFKEQQLFFSYRRDGKTGRMASMIWMDVP